MALIFSVKESTIKATGKFPLPTHPVGEEPAGKKNT
jgi:hypothetical protein